MGSTSYLETALETPLFSIYRRRSFYTVRSNLKKNGLTTVKWLLWGLTSHINTFGLTESIRVSVFQS